MASALPRVDTIRLMERFAQSMVNAKNLDLT